MIRNLAVAFAAMLCAAAYADPLKIAVIEPLSGPSERTGSAYTSAVRYAVKKMNQAGGFNGEPIQLKEYDNLGQAGVALEKLKQAVNDGNQLIWSMSISAISASLNDEVRKHNARNPGKEVVFFSNVYAMDLVQDKCNFWTFKWGTNAWGIFKPAARVMAEKGVLGKKVYLINANYSFGQEAERAQREAAKELGIEVVGSDFVELLKTQDFTPYVAKAKTAGATAVMSGLFGTDLVLFIKAMGGAGMKLPVVALLDNVGTIAAAGDAAVGSYLPRSWLRGVGGDAGKALVEDYEKEMGRPLVDYAPESLFATLFIGEAGKRMPNKGGPIDPKALVVAIEQTRMKIPGSEIWVRAEDHQGMVPMTISLVSKDAPYKQDGTNIGFLPVKTIPPQEIALPVSPSCKIQRPPGA